MPENNQETGVIETVSPAVESSPETVNTPAESTSVQTKVENNVPYSRFKEVNDKMRSHESELVELRKQLASHNVPANDLRGLDMSKYSERLSSKGLDPKAADVLSEVMAEVAAESAKASVADYESKVEAKRVGLEKAAKEMAEVRSNFEKAHPDHAEYKEDMQKEWEGLDEAAKLTIVSSPKSLELLYKAARSARLESEKQKGVEEGRQEAYSGKSLKAALSSAPGTTAQPGKKFTAEDVGKMTSAQYKANEDKILSDLGYK